MTCSELKMNDCFPVAQEGCANPSFGQVAPEKPSATVAVNHKAETVCGKERRELFNKCPRRGRPARLTTDLKRFLCILVSLGMSRRMAARHVDIDHSTISRAAQRDPVFASSLRRAKELRANVPQVAARGWRAQARALVEQRSQSAFEQIVGEFS